MKKVSIIIPIYNSEEYLKRCIDSVINQTYKNLEIILIDDGSTDLSGKMCDTYSNNDSRIKVIHKKNSGVSDTRNQGIKIATGTYFLFIDSDDWLENNMVETLVKYKEKNKCDIVRCNYYKNCSDGSEIKCISHPNYTSNPNMNQILKDVYSNNNFPAFFWTMLIDSEYKKEIVFDSKIAMMEDTDCLAKLVKKTQSIYFCDEYLYHYYVNTESASRSDKNLIRNYENLLILNDKYHRRENNIEILECIDITHANIIIGTCIKLFSSKNYDKKDKYSNLKCILNNTHVQRIFSSVSTKSISFKKKNIFLAIKRNSFNSLIFNLYLFILFKKIYKKI